MCISGKENSLCKRASSPCILKKTQGGQYGCNGVLIGLIEGDEVKGVMGI